MLPTWLPKIFFCHKNYVFLGLNSIKEILLFLDSLARNLLQGFYGVKMNRQHFSNQKELQAESGEKKLFSLLHPWPGKFYFPCESFLHFHNQTTDAESPH